MRFVLVLLLFSTAGSASAQAFHLFVGTYTGTGSKGIYVYRFDAKTGKAALLSHTDSAENPSFLAMAPDRQTLYACNETASAEGGRVSAYRFDRKAGRLRLLNGQPTLGDHPCYVAVHRSGNWLLAGNYSGGNVAAFPLAPDGKVQPAAQVVQHKGNSISPRQTSPHVHATVFSPDGRQVVVPDLGKDKWMLYDFTAREANPLRAAADSAVTATPGSGPRHFVFHPNGRWAYGIEELTGSVVVYRYSGKRLLFQQRVLTHTDTARGPFGSADIEVSPDGKFLYASNRGVENNLAIFRIDGKSGALLAAGYQPTLGLKPRNFCIDPTGNWLLVANQDSDNIVIFRRNAASGKLAPNGQVLKVPRPVCLLMN